MTLQEFATQVKNSDYSPEDKAHAIRGFFYSQVAKTDEFASASDDNKARVIKGFEIVMNEVSKPESNILEQAWSGFREGAIGKLLNKATAIPLRKEVPIEERSQPLEFVREQFDKPIPPPEGIGQTVSHALGSVGSDLPMYMATSAVLPEVAAVSKVGQLASKAGHGAGTFAIPTAASTGGDIEATVHSAGLGALLPVANLPARRIFRALSGAGIGVGYTGATGGNKDEIAANSILFGVMSALSPQMRFKVIEEAKANPEIPIAELPSIKEEFKKAEYVAPKIENITGKTETLPDYANAIERQIGESEQLRQSQRGAIELRKQLEQEALKKEYITPDVQSGKMKPIEEPKGFEGQPIETEIPVYETTPPKPQNELISKQQVSRLPSVEGVEGLSEKASPLNIPDGFEKATKDRWTKKVANRTVAIQLSQKLKNSGFDVSISGLGKDGIWVNIKEVKPEVKVGEPTVKEPLTVEQVKAGEFPPEKYPIISTIRRMGGIDPKKASGMEGELNYYSIKEGFNLLNRKGVSLERVLEELRANEVVKWDATLQDLFDGIDAEIKAKGIHKGKPSMAEQELEWFKTPEKIRANELSVGDKFTEEGHTKRVTDIDPDTEKVKIENGGTKIIDPNEAIYVDRGSLKHGIDTEAPLEDRAGLLERQGRPDLANKLRQEEMFKVERNFPQGKLQGKGKQKEGFEMTEEIKARENEARQIKFPDSVKEPPASVEDIADRGLIPISVEEAKILQDLNVDEAWGMGRKAVIRLKTKSQGEQTGMEGWFVYDLPPKEAIRYGTKQTNWKAENVPIKKETLNLFNKIRNERENRISAYQKSVSDTRLQTDNPLKSEQGGASLDLLVPESLERLANFTSNKITDAIPHLENIGKSVYRAGMKFNDFISRMKDSLGNLWNKFKGLIPRIWMGVKKWNEGLGERGSVRIWDEKSEKWTETSGKVTPKDMKFDEKSVEPSPEITPKEYGFKGRTKGAWKDTLKNFIGITSTELGKIHNDIKIAARKNVLGRMRETYLDEVVAKPFLDANKKLSLDDQMRLKEASLNGWENTARGIIGDSLNGIKALFEKTRQRAIKAGYDIQEFTGFYFPRVVGDAKGLLNVLRQDKYQKEWSAIDDAIREIEIKKGGLTDVEKSIVADQMLRGYPKEKITLSEPYTDPAHMKSRKIKEIPPELLKYYLDLPEALTSYIKSMNHAIKTAEFFGKGKKDINLELITDADLQKSIGDYVIKLKKEGKLKAEDEFKLRDYLQAVFKPTHANYGVQAFKNLTYIQVLGQFSPALTQIIDFALVSEKIGYKEAFRGYGKAIMGKSEIKTKDIGVDKILYEFSQGGEDYIAKVLDKTLKLTGFSAIDRLGKEALLNGKLFVMRKQARSRDPKLIKELKDLDLPIEKIINDLIAGKKSENILFILANTLSDLQPISELEVPKGYLKANYGKVFYMLKTYQLKLLDVYRNEVYEKIRRGTREEKIEGIKKFATLSTALFLLGASTDQIKDFMLMRKTDFNDMMWDNFFRIFGVSKYTLWQARQMGLTKAALTMISPPAGVLETGLKDLQSLVLEGDFDKDLLSTKYIPMGGGLYYWWFGAGAEKMREKELKDK